MLGARGQDPFATLPINLLDALVFDLEGVLLRHGGDDLLGAFDFAQSDVNPDILEHVGHLAEKCVDALKA